MSEEPPIEQRNGFWWLPAHGRRITSQLQAFFQIEASGGIVLILAAGAALIWVNTLGASYHEVWEQQVTVGAGQFKVSEPLEGWVNDALMAIFFFVVGLEIKRELAVGELRDPRTAALPIVAAIGGMALPSLIFWGMNRGAEGADGWAIPVATDIAFAMGVLALFGRRIPSGLRLFLLTLAIVDDIGGIVIIAIFFTEDISLVWLFGGLAGIGLVVAMQRANVTKDRISPYVPIGIFVWYAIFQSGVHATIAGVLLGLFTPAGPVHGRLVLRELERFLHPWSSFLILPLFALANTGIEITGGSLSAAFTGRIAWGIILGLFVGKTVGISVATFAGTWLGAGRLPAGVNRRQVVGAAALGGIGFTVALFIATLSFEMERGLLEEAKMGILAGSLISGALGAAILLLMAKGPDPDEAGGSQTEVEEAVEGEPTRSLQR